METKIDFVITWVDGNDPVWRQEKREYSEKEGLIAPGTNADSESRYREWNILHYWFRAVEKYAPWVNKVYFITYGHLPPFLKTEHPKLKIVNHKDFIPEEYLPTYNSNVIEMNIHRIEGLSEHFVLFNDDMFLNAPVRPEQFFKDGIPCEEGIEGLIVPTGENDIYYHILLNDIGLINKHFRKRQVIKNSFFKWYSLKYGFNMLQNVFLAPWRVFNGIKNAHLPVALCKSTLAHLWEVEYEECDGTSRHRFRDITDISQYLIRYWQLAEGRFWPRKSIGQYFDIRNEQYEDVLNAIREGKHQMICINDVGDKFDFERCTQRIQEAFDTRLPEKSSFER